MDRDLTVYVSPYPTALSHVQNFETPREGVARNYFPKKFKTLELSASIADGIRQKKKKSITQPLSSQGQATIQGAVVPPLLGSGLPDVRYLKVLHPSKKIFART